MGRAIGWYASKVCRVLKWRRSGYRETSPFGPTTRAGRASRRKGNKGTRGGGAAKPPDDDDGNASLVGHCSPSYQRASRRAPVRENLPSGPTQTERLPSMEAATRETQAPQTLTAPPREEPIRKRRRSGNRHLRKEKLPAKNSKVSTKLSPERMRVVLNALAECPILSSAANKAGIHRKTLERWIKRSNAGHEGYDVEWRGERWRFHEHCESAIGEAHDTVLLRAREIALGVRYKTDPSLVKLGYRGVDAFATDEDGNFIEEVVGPPDPKMLRFLLELVLPERYGKHRKSDIPRTSGVLVVGQRTEKRKNKNSTAASIKARKWKSASRKVRSPKT
jgi:hypothetical protein